MKNSFKILKAQKDQLSEIVAPEREFRIRLPGSRSLFSFESSFGEGIEKGWTAR